MAFATLMKGLWAFAAPDSIAFEDSESVLSRNMILTRQFGADRFIVRFDLRPRRKRLSLVTMWVEIVG